MKANDKMIEDNPEKNIEVIANRFVNALRNIKCEKLEEVMKCYSNDLDLNVAVYLCNKKVDYCSKFGCQIETDESMKCKHTADIRYAKNFEKHGLFHYWEKEPKHLTVDVRIQDTDLFHNLISELKKLNDKRVNDILCNTMHNDTHVTVDETKSPPYGCC